MWWRRGALCLFGIEEAAFRESPPDYPTSAPSVQQRPTSAPSVQQRRPLGRLRARYMAGKQASHSQFRIAVGIAAAVCGKQWRYSYLPYIGEQLDRRRSGQVPQVHRKQFTPPADIHGLSAGIQRMSAHDWQPVTVFEHRNGEPGGTSSRSSGLELA